jgi:hypothetical protein
MTSTYTDNLLRSRKRTRTRARTRLFCEHLTCTLPCSHSTGNPSDPSMTGDQRAHRRPHHCPRSQQTPSCRTHSTPRARRLNLIGNVCAVVADSDAADGAIRCRCSIEEPPWWTYGSSLIGVGELTGVRRSAQPSHSRATHAQLTALYAVKCATAASPGHACAVDRPIRGEVRNRRVAGPRMRS